MRLSKLVLPLLAAYTLGVAPIKTIQHEPEQYHIQKVFFSRDIVAFQDPEKGVFVKRLKGPNDVLWDLKEGDTLTEQRQSIQSGLGLIIEGISGRHVSGLDFEANSIYYIEKERTYAHDSRL